MDNKREEINIPKISQIAYSILHILGNLPLIGITSRQQVSINLLIRYGDYKTIYDIHKKFYVYKTFKTPIIKNGGDIPINYTEEPLIDYLKKEIRKQMDGIRQIDYILPIDAQYLEDQLLDFMMNVQLLKKHTSADITDILKSKFESRILTEDIAQTINQTQPANNKAKKI